MQPLLTFYGDDFTGSSAVMEVLAFAGLPCAMFLDAPDPALLARFADLKAVGIAGIARSRSPDWMDAHLPPLFAALKALGAPVLHYKTCSTFDSAPHLGSIGRASEIGLRVTGARFAPLVVGAPAIGRYQMFGTLFAAFEGEVYRLDRHPVMSRHPATPMAEADLCRHLQAQTSLRSAVVDLRTIMADGTDAAVRQARDAGARIVALDVFDAATLERVGAHMWRSAAEEKVFAVGSQGVEYALVAHWQASGLLPQAYQPPVLTDVDRLLVVSGSCSLTTARQIASAEAAGFAVLALDGAKAVDPVAFEAEVQRVGDAALALLGEGHSVVVCTARGPDDPAIAGMNAAIAAAGVAGEPVQERLGAALGRLVRRARRDLGLPRAVIAGGDTSGHALLALGAEALMPVCPLAPGAPLVRVIAANAESDGMELSLKGGQMGGADFFVRALRGA